MKIKISDISAVGAQVGQVPRVNSSGVLEWGDAATGGDNGGGGTGTKLMPTLVQKAPMRNDGDIVLPATPTPGNMLIWITGGWRDSLDGYRPNGFQPAGRYYGNQANAVQAWTRTILVGDGTTYNVYGGDNQGGVLYEFTNCLGLYPLAGGPLAYSGSQGSITVPPNPYDTGAEILLSAEHDTLPIISFVGTGNLTVDRVDADDGLNHKSTQARMVGVGGDAQITTSSYFTDPVWGAFALIGKVA